MRKIDFVTIIILQAIFLALNCRAANFSIKSQNIFALESYSQSHRSLSALNKPSKNNNYSASIGIGPCILESTGSLVCGTVSSIPTMYIAFIEAFAGISYRFPPNYYMMQSSVLCISTSLLIPLGSAMGASFWGTLLNQHGSFNKSFSGAMRTGFTYWGISSAILTGVLFCGKSETRFSAPLIAIACTSPAMIVGPIIGSVKGYNEKRKKRRE